MKETNKVFWRAFRLGVGEAAVFAAPFVATAGCVIGLYSTSTRMRELAVLMLVYAVLTFWLGKKIVANEKWTE